VGALTQILELGLLVEGNFRLIGFTAEDIEFVLVVVLIFRYRVLTVVDDALDVVVGVDDLLHLILDLSEVVLVEVDARDIVVEALLSPRADGECGVVGEP